MADLALPTHSTHAAPPPAAPPVILEASQADLKDIVLCEDGTGMIKWNGHYYSVKAINSDTNEKYSVTFGMLKQLSVTMEHVLPKNEDIISLSIDSKKGTIDGDKYFTYRIKGDQLEHCPENDILATTVAKKALQELGKTFQGLKPFSTSSTQSTAKTNSSTSANNSSPTTIEAQILKACDGRDLAQDTPDSFENLTSQYQKLKGVAPADIDKDKIKTAVAEFVKQNRDKINFIKLLDELRLIRENARDALEIQINATTITKGILSKTNEQLSIAFVDKILNETLADPNKANQITGIQKELLYNIYANYITQGTATFAGDLFLELFASLPANSNQPRPTIALIDTTTNSAGEVKIFPQGTRAIVPSNCLFIKRTKDQQSNKVRLSGYNRDQVETRKSLDVYDITHILPDPPPAGGPQGPIIQDLD